MITVRSSQALLVFSVAALEAVISLTYFTHMFLLLTRRSSGNIIASDASRPGGRVTPATADGKFR